MSTLLEYLIANPQIVSYAITGVTAVVSYFFVAKTKRQKKEALKKAFKQIGLHGEALDLLTGSIETADGEEKKVKQQVTKDKPSISALAETLLHESIDISTGNRNRPKTEKQVEDLFKNWAAKLLDKEK